MRTRRRSSYLQQHHARLQRRRRVADRSPAFIHTYENLLDAAVDASGGDPAFAGKWVEQLINGSNNAGWIHSILKDLLSGDDQVRAKFIDRLQPEIAKFLSDEVAEDIYSVSDQEEPTFENYPGDDGPYGRIK